MSTRHQAEDITPNPESLIESLRDFGYTLPSAIADLVDNSLTAGAREIFLTVASDGRVPAHVAIVDDGSGMSLKTLVAAMRLGTVGPLAVRAGDDLGRFGLGLKTASLSQGRCVTVISKRAADRAPILRRFDISHVRKSRQWQLLDDATDAAAPFLERIAGMKSGTAVIIDSLDRASFLRVKPYELHEHLGRALLQVREHLEMVFHQFLEDGMTIRLGGAKLSPWDPFLLGKSAELPSETLMLGEGQILVRPFVLPHHTKLTDEEHRHAAGPLGWNAHQGFYIYRCRRLIVPGAWLNLPLRKAEHYKLARIAVDLPNSVDSEWHLNVIKSHVAAPAYLRDDLRRIGDRTRKEAAEVYRFRGEREAPSASVPERFVWKREHVRAGIRYRVDRTHPVVRSLLHAGCGHDVLLDRVLQLVEQTVPIAAMLQEPAKALDGSLPADSAEAIDAYVVLVCHAEQFLIRAGKPPAEARKIVLSVEPFVRYRDQILTRLQQLPVRYGDQGR